MTLDRPAGWTETRGFLLASTEPCLSIRDEELAAVRDNRVLVGVDDLADWEPPESWLLGVVLCPGDGVAPLVAWMSRRRRDADRVRFYLHPETPVEVLRPWAEAGLPVRRVQADIASWQQLHKRFGLALNDRVYADAP